MIDEVGIFVKRKDPAAADVACDLVRWLNARDVQVFLEPDSACCAPSTRQCVKGRIFNRSKLLIVLGGDGTMIAAVRALSGRQVPVMGVNMGHLGFLTEITLEEMYPAVEQALQGRLRVENRMTLQATHISKAKGRRRTRHVLNDVVINKSAIARMLDLDVSLDGGKLALIKADGMVAATPTGSTAYAMSAGGPIVHTGVRSILIAPICPHTLNLRPVVLSDTAQIRVDLITERADAYITFDGQEGWSVDPGDRIHIRRGRYEVPIIQSPSKSTFDIMRSKLHWGER
ncbi:MAG: NAD(+)/NADH kinase [Candidatus Alcyoniella australis]|nr:NAD(+)/NADH kinase [Candidatus Alcyoniella australis]